MEKLLEELLVSLKRRIRVDGVDQDELLKEYLEDAVEAVLSYCNRDDVVTGMNSAIRSLAVIYYNREGAEGEASRSEGGVSQSFEEGIPKSIKDMLSKYRIAKVRNARG